MRYTTVNDCWAVIEKCGDIDEVKDFIDEFPNKFGKWSIRFEKGSVTVKVFVRNDYYNDQYDTMEYEERELEDLEMNIAPEKYEEDDDEDW